MKFIFLNRYNLRQILVLFLILLSDAFCFGQSQIDGFYGSHATYWYYRTRLRNDFMLVGPEQGMSIPMQERGYLYYPYFNPSDPSSYYNFTSAPYGSDGKTAKWGDAMGDLGYYIGVLATEYELLKSNWQNTDSTVKELYYALYALNRMDLNAERLWTLATSQPKTLAMDGFMARDDVDWDFVRNNYGHFNYFGNRGFCSNIKINNSSVWDGSTLNQTTWAVAAQGEGYKGSFISQDNYYNVLVGLSLVRKFVDANASYKIGGSVQYFQDIDNNISSLKAEALNIATRAYNFFVNRRNPITGFLKYPDGSPIASGNGGYVGPYSFAHSEAFAKTLLEFPNNLYDHYLNPTEGSEAFHDICDEYDWEHAPVGTLTQTWRQTIGWGIRAGLYVPMRHSALLILPYTGKLHEADWRGAIAYANGTTNPDQPVMVTNLMAICACGYKFEENSSGHDMQYIELHNDLWHGQLLRAALYGSEACDKVESNYFPDWRGANELDVVWNSLLSTAPCEPQYSVNGHMFHTSGPFSYKNGFGPINLMSEWSSTSRLDAQQRRGVGNNDFMAEYNGLDYMLYHNLYFLVRRKVNPGFSDYLVDFSNRNLTLSYPIIGTNNTDQSNPWGSLGNPAIVGAYEAIKAACIVNNNAVVTMKAGKEIQLQHGFSATNGAQWGAVIEHLDCSSIFNQDNNFDNINVRTTGNEKPGKSVNYAAMPTHYDSSLIIKSIVAAPNVEPIQGKKHFASLVIPSKVSSINLSNNSSVYPNPNNGVFVLQINNPMEVKDYEIQDMLGQNVYSSTNSIMQENIININFLSPGIYTLKITDKNLKTYSKKIIKN